MVVVVMVVVTGAVMVMMVVVTEPSVMVMMVVMAIPVMMVMMVMRRDLHIRVGSRTCVGSGFPPGRRRVSRFDVPQQSESIRNRIQQLRIGSCSQNLGRIRARYGRGLRSVERYQPRNCANQADDLVVHTRLLGVDGGGACLPSRLPTQVKQYIVAFVPPPGHADREFEYTIMNKHSG
jgi:predicted signal transduction protein with EAL and GGDEF domain